MYDYILKKEKVWWNPSTWDEDECKLVLSAAVCIGSIVIDCITKANTKKIRREVLHSARNTGRRILIKSKNT